MVVPSPVGDVKIVSQVGTFMLNNIKFQKFQKPFFEGLIFGGAYIRRGSSMEGN